MTTRETEPLGALLTHLRLYYSDHAIRHDMDCVEPLAASRDDLEVLRRYARLRRRASGFRPYSSTSNNHAQIDPAALSRLTVDAVARSCEQCDRPLDGTRADARFCSTRCRVKAARVTARGRSGASEVRV